MIRVTESCSGCGRDNSQGEVGEVVALARKKEVKPVRKFWRNGRLQVGTDTTDLTRYVSLHTNNYVMYGVDDMEINTIDVAFILY